MKAFLKLPDHVYEELAAHLFESKSEFEQAAFLFATESRDDQKIILEAIQLEKLGTDDFVAQEDCYLEMTDPTLGRIIKRAHDLRTCLVEVHSHVGDWPAAFSRSDVMGLKETVPHIWWRLDNRPYLALVFARTGFDALLFLETPNQPRRLDAILAGKQKLMPTNLSAESWK